MENKSLGFIGGGRVVKIFLQAFQNKNISFKSIVVYDINPEVLKMLKGKFPEIEIAGSAKEPAGQDIVFIALHPPVIMETLGELTEVLSENAIVISLAPKITAERMTAVLPTQKFARMIPNATSFINKGFSPVYFSEAFEEEEKKSILKILKLLGKIFETEEGKLESYAIVSAMLPTCFWFQWQEMEHIALETGLTEEEAQKAVYSTLNKALKLYYKSGLTPAEVMDLIPVKPIGENETEIKSILNTKLLGLFNKIKP